MMKKSAFIILPTYNEARNIAKVMGKIKRYSNLTGWNISILVVDGKSPDNTAGIVKTARMKDSSIFLIEYPKEGLGRAYVEGIKWVLKKHPETDFVFEMDADRSHDPAYIKYFLKEAELGYDLVIGSRYIQGGKCQDWQKYRRLLSLMGNMYIRYIGGIRSFSDCTSGYRCIRTDLIKKVGIDKRFPKGFAFQIIFLKKAMLKEARIKEIPISFKPRNKGKSKLKLSDFLESLRTTTKLRFDKN